MMDILFAKGLGLTKKRKDGDLQKLLKNMDKKGKESPEEWLNQDHINIFFLLFETIIDGEADFFQKKKKNHKQVFYLIPHQFL